MDFDSPLPNRRIEDEYSDEEHSDSELKASHLHKSLAQSRRPTDDQILNYKDIITDEQTLEFIKKHFSQTFIEVSFNVDAFIEVLLQEFFLRNPSVVSTVEDVKTFKKELKKLLRTSLTTNDETSLSLNALEVHTKSKGLYNFVFDLAMEAQSMMKIKENNKINEAILEELNAVSKMLNCKRQELLEYEQRLKDYERSLGEREEKMKMLLQSEYERLLKSFEDNYKTKIVGIQKRVLAHEKTTKAKIKLFETKAKEFKAVATSSTNAEDKWKTKVTSLEKSNEFLKLKAQELEKKLQLEQESKATLTKKIEKLQLKITSLEKTLKETQEKQSEPPSERASEKKEMPHPDDIINYLAASEKPLEIVDLNTSKNIPEEEDEDDEIIVGDKSQPPTIRNEEKAPVKKGVSKVLTFDTSPAQSSVKKKLVTKSPSSDEVKVLLSVIHHLVISLKSTLPVIVQSNHPAHKGATDTIDNLIALTRSIDGEMTTTRDATEPEERNIDIGEIFYPCFNNLIGNITELLPLLNKPHNIKHVFTIVELYYKLLNFFFKFQIQKKFPEGNDRYLTEFEIQSSMNKVKSTQDHVNEIMFSSRVMEIPFIPQTDFWKKIIKTTKPLQSRRSEIQSTLFRSINKENKNPNNRAADPCLNLFNEETVQKEISALLKKFLDQTEFMLKKDTGNQESIVSFHTSLNLETQKYLQMTRVYVALIVLLLSKSRKEQIQAINSLLVDLNSENPKVAEYLKLFFVESEGLDIVLWQLENSSDDLQATQVITDLLLCLNINGSHYKPFIDQISKDEVVKLILEIIVRYGDKKDFCEKMCVIFQRITYHNDLKSKENFIESKLVGIVENKYIKFFREKLSDSELLKNNEFFATNIRSILSNLDAL